MTTMPNPTEHDLSRYPHVRSDDSDSDYSCFACDYADTHPPHWEYLIHTKDLSSAECAAEFYRGALRVALAPQRLHTPDYADLRRLTHERTVWARFADTPHYHEETL